MLYKTFAALGLAGLAAGLPADHHVPHTLQAMAESYTPCEDGGYIMTLEECGLAHGALAEGATGKVSWVAGGEMHTSSRRGCYYIPKNAAGDAYVFFNNVGKGYGVPVKDQLGVCVAGCEDSASCEQKAKESGHAFRAHVSEPNSRKGCYGILEGHGVLGVYFNDQGLETDVTGQFLLCGASGGGGGGGSTETETKTAPTAAEPKPAKETPPEETPPQTATTTKAFNAADFFADTFGPTPCPAQHPGTHITKSRAACTQIAQAKGWTLTAGQAHQENVKASLKGCYWQDGYAIFNTYKGEDGEGNAGHQIRVCRKA